MLVARGAPAIGCSGDRVKGTSMVKRPGPGPDPDRGVYGISVAADLVGMGVQTLRLYEARGLLQPARTDGGTRRYSADDLDRLRRIGDLLDAGLNLAGISMVLNLQDQNTQLEDHNTQLEDQNTQLRAAADAD